MPHKFDNIPHEMRAYKQWVVWKYEQQADGKKPTKVLYNHQSNNHAAVDNPNSWVSFADGVKAYEARPDYWDGIGFVLTETDPYCFVDLDDTSHLPEHELLHADQVRVFEMTSSYAELSPGGNGLHIITKANVSRGRKRNGIEIYSKLRFMTMTGNIFRQGGIEDERIAIEDIWHRLGGPTSRNETVYYQDQTEDDEIVLSKMFNAADGAGHKAREIFEGNWTQYTQSHSEADQALFNYLVFWTKNRDQIVRLFQRSALGQRKKAYRYDYLERSISLAFDRTLPPADMQWLSEAFERMLAEKNGAALEGSSAAPDTASEGEPGRPTAINGHAYLPAPVRPVNVDYPLPPGLVGEIAQFIYDAAPRPVWPIALAGALALVSGIGGRGYNVSGAGINQIIMLLAPTGTGKESANGGMARLCKAIENQNMKEARGIMSAEQIRSDAAFYKMVGRQKCSVSVISEFGLRLQAMTAERAPDHTKAILEALLKVYGKSGRGNVLGAMEYSSEKDNVESIEAPAFTLLGEGTPESFYEALNEKMVTSGFLPRCVIIEYNGPAVPLNEKRINVPPLELTFKLGAFFGAAKSQEENPVEVKFYPDAEARFKQFNAHCLAMQNDKGARELQRAVWSRGLVSAYKLAACVAIGVDFLQPIIDIETTEWACDFIARQSNELLSRFELGLVGDTSRGDIIEQHRAAKRVLRDWMLAPDGDKAAVYGVPPIMWLGRAFPKSALQRRLAADQSFKKVQDRNRAFADLIRFMIDAGEIIALQTSDAQSKYQTTAVTFMLANPSAFFGD